MEGEGRLEQATDILYAVSDELDVGWVESLSQRGKASFVPDLFGVSGRTRTFVPGRAYG